MLVQGFEHRELAPSLGRAKWFNAVASAGWLHRLKIGAQSGGRRNGEIVCVDVVMMPKLERRRIERKATEDIWKNVWKCLLIVAA
jgi:hypothetical protein